MNPAAPVTIHRMSEFPQIDYKNTFHNSRSRRLKPAQSLNWNTSWTILRKEIQWPDINSVKHPILNVGLLPLDNPSESGLEYDAGAITDHFLSKPDVGRRINNVAGAGRFVARGEALPKAHSAGREQTSPVTTSANQAMRLTASQRSR